VDLAQSDRHRLIWDEAEEEDQSLLFYWRNIACSIICSRSLNQGICRRYRSCGGSLRFVSDEKAMALHENVIRWKCATTSAELFIGKPLVVGSCNYPQLMEHFPEAKFVVCWREPVATLASICSLHDQYESAFSMEDWVSYLCDPTELNFPQFYRNIVELREKYGDDDRFVFNPFPEWIASPEKQVARICSSLKLPVVNTSPPPKSEDTMSPEDKKRFTAMAQEVIKRDWATTWRPIYEALGFATPGFI